MEITSLNTLKDLGILIFLAENIVAGLDPKHSR